MDNSTPISDKPATASAKIRKIKLPDSIIQEYARFLVPVIKEYYASEHGKREFAEWQAKYGNGQAGDNSPALSSQ